MARGNGRAGFAGRHVLTWLLSALALAAGCSYPKAVRTYEYISDYDRMVQDYEPLVSLVYAPRPIDLSRYHGVIVGHIAVGDQWVEERSEALGYATYFRVVFRKQLEGLHRFDFVSLGASDEDLGRPLQGVLRVEGKITKFDFGSGTMRYLSYFLFFLQSGATDLQIEGRVTEADTGALVFEFADRRRHLCNTVWGPNPSGVSGTFAMNLTARVTAECLAKFFELACDGPQVGQLPEPARYASGR